MEQRPTRAARSGARGAIIRQASRQQSRGGTVSETADVVIIGGGVIGVAIAWALAERRAGKIVLLERNALGSGASGKSGALVRTHYTNRYDSQLALLSLAVWRTWSERVGGPSPFTETGFLQVV